MNVVRQYPRAIAGDFRLATIGIENAHLKLAAHFVVNDDSIGADTAVPVAD